MIRWANRRIRARRDDGAILVFAILIVTVVALVVGMILTRGDTSLRATVALRTVAGTSYAADAAANVAVNDLRTGYGFASTDPELGFNNSLDGKGCFGVNVGNGGTDKLSLNGFYPATGSVGVSSAYVECAGEAGTGQQGSPVPINSSNKPGYAIVTLNGNLTATAALKVHGGIYANGNIVGSVSLDAGDAKATGTCSATTVSGTATKQCAPSSPAPAVSDPNYTDELGGSVPTLQTPPTSCTGGVATFTPGYYDNADAMNTASSMGCASVLWFKPGNYYFDFHNSSCGTYCPTSVFGQTSNDVWTVPRGVSVVGGTPTNAAGAVISIPSSNPTLPGSCQSPITDVNAVGVQFVFGNDSRMLLAGNGTSGAHMELCGTYHSNRPPIELFGLKTGGTLSASNANGLVPSGAVTTTKDAGTWTNADAPSVGVVGGNAATWTTTGNGTKNATITIPGYVPPSSIPAGSILTGATLNVTHNEAGTAATATIKVNGAAAATGVINVPLRGASGTDSISFNATTNATIFNTLQQQIHDNGFTGATTVYTEKVASNGNATVTIDASKLDLTFAIPLLRGETGTCVATGTACSLVALDPSGNNKIFMYLQGTTYAPVADVNITLSNFSAEVAKFGVIARQLEFNVNTGNPSWTGPVFEIPDNSPGYGYNNTTIDLKVHLCLGSATVTAACQSNTPSLTSRVQLWDPTGVPVPNSRQITVLSWSRTS